MRFAATFGENCLRVVGAVYVFGMPLTYFLAPGPHKNGFIAWAVWLMMLAAIPPQYYEVREDALFLRLRWRKLLFPYASLVEVSDQPNRTGRGARVNLVRVTTNTGESVTFGVEEKGRFLDEVWKRCPQASRTSLYS